MAELNSIGSNVVQLDTGDQAHEGRVSKLQQKVELNELRARDAEARSRIVDAEFKILQLRNEIEHQTSIDQEQTSGTVSDQSVNECLD